MFFQRLILSAACICAASSAVAQTTIGPGGTGNTVLTGLQTSNYTSGQFFTSPGSALTSFSLYVASIGTPGNVFFAIAPYETTFGQVGTPLYQSAVFPLTIGTLTFSGLNIATTAGQRYVAYLTNDGVSNGAQSVGLGDYNNNPYGGTAFPYGDGAYLYQSGSPTSPPVGGFYAGPTDDLAFTATFGNAVSGAVPEPATWAMIIVGFGMLGRAMRRRRVGAGLAAA